MAVTAVAVGASLQTNPFAQARQAFGQLVSAIQSGNLNAAQNAYDTLSSSPLAQSGPVAQAIQQIGQDLASGDIAGAQRAIAALQQQQHSFRAHGHHHHGGIKPAEASNSSDQSQSTSSTQSSPSDPDGDGDNDATPAGAVSVTDSDYKVNITA